MLSGSSRRFSVSAKPKQAGEKQQQPSDASKAAAEAAAAWARSQVKKMGGGARAVESPFAAPKTPGGPSPVVAGDRVRPSLAERERAVGGAVLTECWPLGGSFFETHRADILARRNAVVELGWHYFSRKHHALTLEQGGASGEGEGASVRSDYPLPGERMRRVGGGADTAATSLLRPSIQHALESVAIAPADTDEMPLFALELFVADLVRSTPEVRPLLLEAATNGTALGYALGELEAGIREYAALAAPQMCATLQVGDVDHPQLTYAEWRHSFFSWVAQAANEQGQEQHGQQQSEQGRAAAAPKHEGRLGDGKPAPTAAAAAAAAAAGPEASEAGGVATDLAKPPVGSDVVDVPLVFPCDVDPLPTGTYAVERLLTSLTARYAVCGYYTAGSARRIDVIRQALSVSGPRRSAYREELLLIASIWASVPFIRELRLTEDELLAVAMQCKAREVPRRAHFADAGVSSGAMFLVLSGSASLFSPFDHGGQRFTPPMKVGASKALGDTEAAAAGAAAAGVLLASASGGTVGRPDANDVVDGLWTGLRPAGRLCEGSSFGGLTLTAGTYHTVTAVATDECFLLVLDTEGFQRSLVRAAEAAHSRKLRVLLAAPAFALTPRSVLELLAHSAVIRTARNRQVLVQQGGNVSDSSSGNYRTVIPVTPGSAPVPLSSSPSPSAASSAPVPEAGGEASAWASAASGRLPSRGGTGAPFSATAEATVGGGAVPSAVYANPMPKVIAPYPSLPYWRSQLGGVDVDAATASAAALARPVAMRQSLAIILSRSGGRAGRASDATDSSGSAVDAASAVDTIGAGSSPLLSAAPSLSRPFFRSPRQTDQRSIAVGGSRGSLGSRGLAAALDGTSDSSPSSSSSQSSGIQQSRAASACSSQDAHLAPLPYVDESRRPPLLPLPDLPLHDGAFIVVAGRFNVVREIPATGSFAARAAASSAAIAAGSACGGSGRSGAGRDSATSSTSASAAGTWAKTGATPQSAFVSMGALGVNEIFGEVALLNKTSKRVASVFADQAGTLLLISRSDWTHLLDGKTKLRLIETSQRAYASSDALGLALDEDSIWNGYKETISTIIHQNAHPAAKVAGKGRPITDVGRCAGVGRAVELPPLDMQFRGHFSLSLMYQQKLQEQRAAGGSAAAPGTGAARPKHHA